MPYAIADLSNLKFAEGIPFVPATMVFNLGAPAGAVVIPPTSLPGGAGIIALGGAASTANNGYISVIEPNFVAAGVAAAGLTTEVVDNLIVNTVALLDAATNEPVETPTGEQVFGLLHAWDDVTTVDGVAVAANPNENLQISFVYWSKALVPVLTAFNLPAGNYYFAPNVNVTAGGLGYGVFLGKDVPIPDVLTRVYYVPTFTGVSYASYPQNSIVIAFDTGRSRIVGSTSWLIEKPDVDYTVAAPVVIIVDADAGDDDIGDGLTAGTAYASIDRAYLDIPEDQRGWPYAIGCVSTSPLDLPPHINARGGYISILGNPTLTEIGAYAPDGVGTDTLQAGRRYTDSTNPFGVADEQVGRYVIIDGGILTGSEGWIHDSDAGWVQLEVEYDIWGNMAGGDTLRIYDFPTTFVSGGCRYEGDVRIENCELRLDQEIIMERGSRLTLEKVRVTGNDYIEPRGARIHIINSYLKSSGAGGVMDGEDATVVFDGTGGATVIGSDSPGAGPFFAGINNVVGFFGKVVLNTDNNIVLGSDTLVEDMDISDAAAGSWLRFYGCWGIYYFAGAIAQLRGIGASYANFPYTVGAVMNPERLVTIQTEQTDIHVRFPKGVSVTATGGGVGTNDCTISGGPDGYYDKDRGIRILGTGNSYEKLYDLHTWVPSKLGGPSQGLLVPTMEYATALDQMAASSFRVDTEYHTGSQLYLHAMYDTRTDANPGHDADMRVTGGYLAVGESLANPPANVHTGGIVFWAAGGAVSEIQDSPYMEITDAVGEINGQTVLNGDQVLVNLERVGTGEGADAVTDDVRVAVGTIEVYQLV